MRIFTRSKEAAGHTGQNFKLGIAGAGTNNWHCQMPGREILFQIMHIWDRVLGSLDKVCLTDIKERLQKDNDDIRSVFFLDRGCALIGLVYDRRNGLLIIILRLGHTTIEDTGRKSIQISIIQIALC